MTRNGIGLNGLWRLNRVGVRGEMNACRGSGPRPLFSQPWPIELKEKRRTACSSRRILQIVCWIY
jgi:hypothetical protein